MMPLSAWICAADGIVISMPSAIPTTEIVAPARIATLRAASGPGLANSTMLITRVATQTSTIEPAITFQMSWSNGVLTLK